MFMRLRWFLLGVIGSVTAGVMVVRRARTIKHRLDAEGIARIMVSYGADLVQAVGRGLQRSVGGDTTTHAPSDA